MFPVISGSIMTTLYMISNLQDSKNGIDWTQNGKVCIKLKKGERAVARPFVFIENNIFKMYYCYEKKSW